MKINNNKVSAIGQSLLLILGIMAFGFIFGSEVEVVSAADTTCAANTLGDTDCTEGIESKCVKEGANYKWEIIAINSQTCTDDNKCSDGTRRVLDEVKNFSPEQLVKIAMGLIEIMPEAEKVQLAQSVQNKG